MTDPGYAVAFVLFDVVRQLAELNRALKSVSAGIGEVAYAIADKEPGDGNDP